MTSWNKFPEQKNFLREIVFVYKYLSRLVQFDWVDKKTR